MHSSVTEDLSRTDVCCRDELNDWESETAGRVGIVQKLGWVRESQAVELGKR